MKKVEQESRWEMWATVYKICVEVLLWSIVIILSPLLIFIIICLYIWKYWILRTVVKLFKRNLLEIFNTRESLYATDGFWEDSRASLGLIVVLDGNVTLEKIRENFAKRVIEASVDNKRVKIIPKKTKSKKGGNDTVPETQQDEEEETSKLFPKLTQIPVNFGGAYFWQKANYFLLHEHIRLIESPTDEDGLRKFAGTVMTLPFPNKRPLWEILVFQSYKENASALVIRMHQVIADPESLLLMTSLLSDNGKLRECNWDPNPKLSFQKRDATEESGDQGVLQLVRQFIQIPRYINSFLVSFFEAPLSNQALQNYDNNATVSWECLHSISVRKAVSKYNVDNRAVTMALCLGSIASCSSSSSSGTSSFGAKINLFNKTDDNDGRGRTSSIPILMTDSCMTSTTNSNLGNLQLRWTPSSKAPSWRGFGFVRNYEEINQSSLKRVEKINKKIQEMFEIRNEPKIARVFLRILTLFPSSVLQSIIHHNFQGGVMIFQNFTSAEIFAPSLRKSLEINSLSGTGEDVSSGCGFNFNSNALSPCCDLISIGEKNILQLIPLSGLQFRNTGITLSALKFQQYYSISLTVNSNLVISMLKQRAIDNVMGQLPLELDELFEDGKDENGFVSIPIV